MSARRLGAAAAATGSAAAAAWFCAPSPKDAVGFGSTRALQPGIPLACELSQKEWVSGDAVRLRFALPTPEHTLGLPVPGHIYVVDAATNYRPCAPSGRIEHTSFSPPT